MRNFRQAAEMLREHDGVALPVERLRPIVDVRDIGTEQNDAAIVRAILAMSQSLGLEVIAEGVETEAQRDFLRDNGCHAYQGDLFGKPKPIDEWDAQAGQRNDRTLSPAGVITLLRDGNLQARIHAFRSDA